jgi:hypothetical protein
VIYGERDRSVGSRILVETRVTMLISGTAEGD